MDTTHGPRPSVVRTLDICPVEVAIEVLGGAWKMSVVRHLVGGTLRFNELRRRLDPVTPRVLTRQLRELEADGIVARTVYAEVPPRVEYSLTDLGRTVEPLADQLNAWGAAYAARLTDHTS